MHDVPSASCEADSGLPRPGKLSLMAPQLMPLESPLAIRLTPSCFMTLRLTSATVTFSMTWSSPMISDQVDDAG